MNASFYYPGTVIPNPWVSWAWFFSLLGAYNAEKSKETVLVEGRDTETQECKGHYHPSKEHLAVILEALGEEYVDEGSWNNPRFVRNELDILKQYAMRISVYVRLKNGELQRETMICGPRKEPQIEESPRNFRSIVGYADRERMSGDLEGAPVAEIVAVQLDRGKIIYLGQPLRSAIIAPALHGHTPWQYEDGMTRLVAFGKKLVPIEFKFSETRGWKRIIHPHSETYADLMAAVTAARRDVAQEDRPLELALGPLF